MAANKILSIRFGNPLKVTYSAIPLIQIIRNITTEPTIFRFNKPLPNGGFNNSKMLLHSFYIRKEAHSSIGQ